LAYVIIAFKLLFWRHSEEPFDIMKLWN